MIVCSLGEDVRDQPRITHIRLDQLGGVMDTDVHLEMIYPHARCRCDLAFEMIYRVPCRGWHLTVFSFSGRKEWPRVPLRERALTDSYVRIPLRPLRHASCDKRGFCKFLKIDDVEPKLITPRLGSKKLVSWHGHLKVIQSCFISFFLYLQGARPLLTGQIRLRPDSNPTPNRTEYARPRFFVARTLSIEH